MNRLEPLDSLRGIAAIGIAMFWHYQGAFQCAPFHDAMYWFYHYGALCVDFFFVLSGFVFSYVYGRMILRHEIDLVKFAILRFSRLYPVFFVTTVIVAAMQGLRKCMGYEFFGHPFNDVYHFFLNLLFLHSGWFEQGFSFNAPSWSVACEAASYLIFFYILNRFANGRQAAFVAMVFLGIFLWEWNWQFPLLNSTMGRGFMGFFIGCLLYTAHIRLSATAGRVTYLRVMAALICFLCVMGSLYGHAFYGDRWHVVYVCLLFPSLILFSLHFSALSRILTFSPLVYLGEISYSIYLWHFPIQLAMQTGMDFGIWQFDPSARHVFGLYVILVVASGAVSHFCETKAQKYLRQRFAAR